ncbi:hypothetical protein QTL97_09050 [Sporosarcina thermotolerans]|uniref:TM2 domain-containing protein n=1 Tax=Sporosarcina thermotolerans TaxID=633404 RepID=A0AAW9ABU7_9BACL|nr:NINE protein [Sporosarcina thermotolerans]MDW0117081.1 hypothetical protein [Sporosarcina thermotolerans]WHT47824.1 hypothetical protein QNH10_17255 [Sporosarcina thermotolerans]
MTTPKYIDIALIIFLGYFAIDRFSKGQTGIAIMFTVLSLMNIFVLIMKIKQDKKQVKDPK